MRYQNEVTQSYIVDGETGTAVVDIQPGDVVSVTRRKSVETYRRNEEETVLVNKGRQFVKQFPDIARQLCERLKPNEFWLLQRLLPYVGYGDGVLTYGNGALLSRADVLKVCASKMGRDACDTARKGLMRQGVLAECRIEGEHKYIMNPYVCQRGSRTNATLVQIFKDTIWAEGV